MEKEKVKHLDEIVAEASSEVVSSQLVPVVPEVPETEPLVLVVQSVLDL